MDCGFKYCPIGLLISGYGSNSKYSLLGNGQCLILAMAKRQRTMTNLTTGAKVVMGCDLKIEVFCLLALRYLLFHSPIRILFKESGIKWSEGGLRLDRLFLLHGLFLNFSKSC
jgi:hypothetical protein